MELAIINGTYRDSNKLQQKMNQILIPGGASNVNSNSSSDMRSPPNHLGQPLIISPRLTHANGGQTTSSHQAANAAATHLNAAQLMNAHHQIIASSDPSGSGQLIYTTIPAMYSSDHQYTNAINPALFEYSNGIDFSQAG
jgi:hypothetical protein